MNSEQTPCYVSLFTIRGGMSSRGAENEYKLSNFNNQDPQINVTDTQHVLKQIYNYGSKITKLNPILGSLLVERMSEYYRIIHFNHYWLRVSRESYKSLVLLLVVSSLFVVTNIKTKTTACAGACVEQQH